MRFVNVEGGNRWHIPMFMVSQIVSLSFKGIPAVYIHCLTATPNDALGVERTGMTRSVNRRKWDMGELQSLICDLESETGQVFTLYTRLLAAATSATGLSPRCARSILELDPRVFCFERTSRTGNSASWYWPICHPRVPATWTALAAESVTARGPARTQ